MSSTKRATTTMPHPARVEVMCEGTGREMGLAQGAGLREKIHDAGGILETLEAFRLRQPWFLPYGTYQRLAERKVSRTLSNALRRHLPELQERLEGIAEGSGLKRGTVYLLNAMEAALSSVQYSTLTPPVGACSTLAVRGKRSVTGEPVIARNFDYQTMIQPFYVLRDSRPPGGHRSIDFTVAPMAGALDGINDAGLCITYSYAFVVDEGPPAPPISFNIAEALGRCTSVSDAAALIGSRPRWGGGILMLADADGDIASLELSNTASALRRPGDAEDIIYHTNAFFCEETRAHQVPAGAIYSRRAPTPLRGQRVLEPSEKRDGRFAALIERSNDAFGPDQLAAIMVDHGDDDTPSENTICMHSDYSNTTATMQLFPRTRKLRISYSAACRAQYNEIEL